MLSIKFLSPPPSLAKIVKKYRWTTFLKRGGGVVGWLVVVYWVKWSCNRCSLPIRMREMQLSPSWSIWIRTSKPRTQNTIEQRQLSTYFSKATYGSRGHCYFGKIFKHYLNAVSFFRQIFILRKEWPTLHCFVSCYKW